MLPIELGTPRFGIRFTLYRAPAASRPPPLSGAPREAAGHPFRDPPVGFVPCPRPEPVVPPVCHKRVRIYALALELASRIYAVIEGAEAERYFLRDQLDRKSAIVPQLIAQGLAIADMQARRALYLRARQAVTDCAAILDMLIDRATVPVDVLAPARGLAIALIDELLPLTVPPSRVW